MTAPAWPDMSNSMAYARECQEDRVLRSEQAERDDAERARLEAAAAQQATAPPPQPRQRPTAVLKLPERRPGQLVGGIAVSAGLRGLYRALTAATRGWPAKRRTRLEAALVDLEAALLEGSKR